MQVGAFSDGEKGIRKISGMSKLLGEKIEGDIGVFK